MVFLRRVCGMCTSEAFERHWMTSLRGSLCVCVCVCVQQVTRGRSCFGGGGIETTTPCPYLNLGTGETLETFDPRPSVGPKDSQHILRDAQGHRFPELVIVPAGFPRTQSRKIVRFVCRTRSTR